MLKIIFAQFKKSFEKKDKNKKLMTQFANK